MRKKLVFRLATSFFANSHFSKQDMFDYFNIPLKKIHVTYNAIRLSAQEKVPTDNNKIVFAGRLHFTKGVETLIAAMPMVIDRLPETKLVLIGGYLTGNVIKRYIEMAKNLNVYENIDFKGNVANEIVKKEFSEAYLTVLPSLYEAFGYVVIESFAVNTPVIGSNTSGIAEIIRDGIDGFLFEPGNENDLAEKIIHLMLHPEKREIFSMNCYERVKETFELEKVTDYVVSKIDNLE
jgi:glycosyltransferase involved in cell wall biosynthesis